MPNVIVRVDRSTEPALPELAISFVRPDLQAIGPSRYGLYDIELYLPEKQKGCGHLPGNEVYCHLKREVCVKRTLALGLHDALAIRDQITELSVYRKYFRYKTVYCWKSVIESCGERSFVPFFCWGNGAVTVEWTCLDVELQSDCPAGIFSNQML
jgi:hypothetical protein